MELILCVLMSAILCEVFTLDPCASHKTCNTCIRDTKACMWCTTKQNLTSRCISENLVSSDWCLGGVINPKSKQEIDEEQEFGLNQGKIVQIKPQRIKMRLRPGQPINFNFSFYAAEDYPVDLYFLFDASDAMTKLRSQTAEQSKDLYEKMQEITRNVYLGLGTFVDKNAFPFANIKDSSLSYSFKHRLKLCDDYTTFKELVSNVNLGKSHDFSNGGLDALAQVMVCKETIGWRNESRKIVVFLTNAPYHAAGDGKWAGIFEPYDGKCYTENQTYTKELEMDYPSTSIINELASDEEILIIFLIIKSRSQYDHLKKVVKGSIVIPYNSKEGVSEILTDIYKKISRSLQLKVNMESMYKNKIKISFSPNCYDNDKEKCEVNPASETNFVGTIEVLEYFKENNIQFDIGFQGIKEKLTLDVEVIKECDCEKEDNKLCNGGGIRRCGICECFPDRHGDNCMCNSTTDMTNQDKKGCIASNDTSVECSGRGSCICGSCVCDNWYKGVFCECATNNCPSNKNGMCGGHGSCECGVCMCHEGWSGETCGCAESTKLCETGANMCYDYGRCYCGECKCTTLCDWDARSKQDSFCRPSPCPDCHDRQCQLLQPYALSTASRTRCNERVNVTSVSNLTCVDVTGWKQCTNVRADVGCYTQFIYRYDEERYAVHVIVQSDLDCVTSYYIIGGSCLGMIILIGITTLVAWKACTMYRDRKEYNRFVKQQGLEEQYLNPLFKPAFSTFTNPAFRKQSIFYN